MGKSTPLRKIQPKFGAARAWPILSQKPEQAGPDSVTIGREYDRRLTSDIETGLKSWETLNNCIDPTCWSFAKELVPKMETTSNVSPEGVTKSVHPGINFGNRAANMNF